MDRQINRQINRPTEDRERTADRLMDIWRARWTDAQTERQTDRLIIKMNGASRFLDHENIVLDTNIIILCAFVQKLWPKTCFCTMAANIMHPYLANIQTAKNFGIGQDLS